MEVDFGANQTPVETQETNPKAEPAAETSAVLVPSKQTNALMLGDSLPSFSEIVFPRINIAQAIGDLKDEFEPGSLVFNRTLSLFTPPDIRGGKVVQAGTEPVTMVVIGIRDTRYVEKISGGVRGLIVDSEQAVRDNGGTLDWKEWKLKEKSGMKIFQYYADAVVLVERPSTVADDDSIFVCEVAGKKYTLALWGMKGSAFTAGIKPLKTKRRMGSLLKGYPTYSFSVSTRFAEWDGGKEAWVPVFTEKEKTSPAILAFLKETLSANA